MVDEVVFWLEDHAIPVFAVLGVALVVVGYLAFTVPQRDDAVTRDETELRQLDTDATAGLVAASTALDAYAGTNNGSYSGATAEKIEESVPEGTDLPGLTVEARDSAYTVSVTSESGATFSIERAADGSLVYPCGPPGIGLCRDTTTWR